MIDGMDMDARNHGELHARAELYLTLARAFLAPRDEALARAMHEALADDLHELAAELSLDIAAPLAALRAALAALPEPLQLLQAYSAIFLSPPAAAWINAGQYVDRALDGGSVREMEQAYRAAGVERAEHFHDLADHVSVQLEFVAMLLAAQASRLTGETVGDPLPVDPGEFLHRYASRWIGPLLADLDRAAATKNLAGNPYLPLARILQQAVLRDAVAPEVDARLARKQRAIERARATVAVRGISEQDLEEMRRKLAARGLSTEHLQLPPGTDGAH